MSEYFPVSSTPELSERLARMAEESPTLGKILRGEATMVRLQGGPTSDYSRGQLGERTTYDVTIPDHRPDGSAWNTTMSRWERLPLVLRPYERPEKPQVDILTGEGTMPFSRDPEVISAVLDEMYRQDALRLASATTLQ